MSKPDKKKKHPYKDAPQYILVGAMLVATFLVYSSVQGATSSGDIDLGAIPMQIGDWAGKELILTDLDLDTLGAKQYLLREYSTDEQTFTLYITYFDTGHGALTHNPEKCFTGSGWTFLDREKIQVPGTDLSILKSTVVKGGERQLLMYWYQEHETVLVSKWGHIFSVLSKALLNRQNRSFVFSIAAKAEVERNEHFEEGQATFARQVMQNLADKVL